MTLEEKVQQFREGNTGIFPEILQECEHMIYKIISSYRLVQGDFFISREDLYQEACMGLYDAVKSYETDRGMKFSSFAWLVIKRRVARIYRRTRNVYAREPSSLDAREDYAEPAVEEKKEEDLLSERTLERFIRNLKEEDRKILTMRLSKKGYQEIAEELSISPKRVDNRIYRMRRKYRQTLVKEGLPVYERTPLTKPEKKL